MTGSDYYRTLGIRRGASGAEIKAAYRKRVREFHPDLNPGNPQALEYFQQIQEAYRVLRHPDSRQAYDDSRSSASKASGEDKDSRTRRSRVRPRKRSAFRSNGWRRSLVHLIRFFLPGMSSRNSYRRTLGSLETTLEISFVEAVLGTRSEIKYQRKHYCRRCGGNGGRRTLSWANCDSCQGTGKVRRSLGLATIKSVCADCNGKGKHKIGSCRECGGKGFQERVERLILKLSPGVEDGQRIRIREKGNVLPGKREADNLTVRIRVKPHPFFRRVGSDVICPMPLTVAEATLGAEIEIPTVYGRARLSIPPGTRQGQRFRLKGRGVAGSEGRSAGDQIIEIGIVMPTLRTEQTRRILRELERQEPVNPRAWMLKESDSG